MKNCQFCGAALDDQANFCNSCGSSLEGAAPNPEQQPNQYQQPPQQQPYYGQPPQPNYGPQPYADPYMNPYQKPRTAPLVLGIIGVIFAILLPLIAYPCSIVGLVMANTDIKRGLTFKKTYRTLNIVALVIAGINSLLGVMLAFA